eukprot:gnl/MRDRNA2_/MRDRNA2_161189_c0_seq1.p1 gnl/MRDRNA2_/MRDRNA2_161189_c0~~gnl/MRDRNA2_/MRDRNA2_161189_c0_seq1.p1  ORF type:complete len:154 (+),score=37.74 gnl/MRDRNA2_/MRDRNA2_161189_c0_seq1:47-463(+)
MAAYTSNIASSCSGVLEASERFHMSAANAVLPQISDEKCNAVEFKEDRFNDDDYSDEVALLKQLVHNQNELQRTLISLLHDQRSEHSLFENELDNLSDSSSLLRDDGDDGRAGEDDGDDGGGGGDGGDAGGVGGGDCQ